MGLYGESSGQMPRPHDHMNLDGQVYNRITADLDGNHLVKTNERAITKLTISLSILVMWM